MTSDRSCNVAAPAPAKLTRVQAKHPGAKGKPINAGFNTQLSPADIEAETTSTA